jgi:hypothetical protein
MANMTPEQLMEERVASKPWLAKLEQGKNLTADMTKVFTNFGKYNSSVLGLAQKMGFGDGKSVTSLPNFNASLTM